MNWINGVLIKYQCLKTLPLLNNNVKNKIIFIYNLPKKLILKFTLLNNTLLFARPIHIAKTIRHVFNVTFGRSDRISTILSYFNNWNVFERLTWYRWTHIIRIRTGPKKLFVLHDFRIKGVESSQRSCSSKKLF